MYILWQNLLQNKIIDVNNENQGCKFKKKQQTSLISEIKKKSDAVLDRSNKICFSGKLEQQIFSKII